MHPSQNDQQTTSGVKGSNISMPNAKKSSAGKPSRPRPVCQVCGRSFSKPANLRAHERIHTGEKRYSCPICEKRFVWKSSLNFHGRTAHKELSNHHGNDHSDSTSVIFTAATGERVCDPNPVSSPMNPASSPITPPSSSTPPAPSTPNNLKRPLTPKTSPSFPTPTTPLSPNFWFHMVAGSDPVNVHTQQSCNAHPGYQYGENNGPQFGQGPQPSTLEYNDEGNMLNSGVHEENTDEPQFTLYGQWEDDSIVGEVPVPDFQPENNGISTLLHLTDLDLEAIASDTPSFDESSGLEALDEPGQPLVFF